MLSEKLKYTKKELLERMSSSELTEWMAYFSYKEKLYKEEEKKAKRKNPTSRSPRSRRRR